MTQDPIRATSRELAAEYLAKGDDTGWFEELYSRAAQGTAVVPWTDMRPNPMLVEAAPQGTGTALVIGCGFGDDAEYLASLGWRVTAFDVSETAVAQARRRFRQSGVDYVVADLLEPPAQWSFDLVVEIYTIQVLFGQARSRAIDNTIASTAPGGRLLVIARAREESAPAGLWSLHRGEIEAMARPGVRLDSLDEVWDDEEPPVRRWVAWFQA